ncbi:MAG: hypothetical protein Kow0019_11700 [Methanobacteriaceae archaeon]
MIQWDKVSTLRISEFEEAFRRIILRKSWNEEIVDLVNNHLFTHTSCGSELPNYNSLTCRTYAGVPLIQDSDNTMDYSYIRNGDVFTVEHFSKHITFTGEIHIATEISSKDYRILFHEIVPGEIDIKRIIAKYEKSWVLLSQILACPMQKEEFPVIIWGWKEKIETTLALLDWKEAKLIEIGMIKLVPLDILVEEVTKYFNTREEDNRRLFSFK